MRKTTKKGQSNAKESRKGLYQIGKINFKKYNKTRYTHSSQQNKYEADTERKNKKSGLPYSLHHVILIHEGQGIQGGNAALQVHLGCLIEVPWPA